MYLLALLLVIQSPALQPVPYYDPAGREPTGYEEYRATRTDGRFESTTLSRSGETDDPLVVVLVNADLAPLIADELTTWCADVAAEGRQTKTIAVSGGRPADLRACLQVHRDSGLAGALLVGDLPVAWWSGGTRGEDFPLDLFFTDLDGVFTDQDGDGRYDGHTGSRAPDIWTGRVYASRLTYDCEERLVRAWFDRNHAYRTGALSVPRRGLVYNEVTWYPNDHGMGNLYTDVTMYNDANTTTAHHYKGELRLGYEFVHVIAHSSPWVHTFFLQNDQPGGGSVFNFELPPLEPNAAFYFLNACMCARYTEKDNLGNWYLFAGPWSQAVIASAELMYGVSSLATVYNALAHDSCIGDAFLKWHRSNYTSFRGTCLLGDPTLALYTGRQFSGRPAEQRAPASSPRLDWTEHVVDSSDFVNGNPAIGCSNGRVRVVFDSGRKVRADTYWSWFNGTGFTAPESIAWHEYYDVFPACATDASGRFWVAWQSFRDYNSNYDHFQALTSFYHNNGWSSVQRVGSLQGYHDVQPALAAGADDKVWCAFKSWRNGQADIWVSSAQSGGAWSTPVRLTDDSLGQVAPCVAVDSENHPWVFWSSLSHGNWRIQGRRHDGSGWLPVFELDTVGNASCPRAAAAPDGSVMVVWHRWSGEESDVFSALWNGSGWSAPEPVNSDPADDILPDVCVGPSGDYWSCWQSKRTGHWDVYAAGFADGWTLAQAVTSDDASDFDPVIAADSNGVWIAWSSDRRGYWNIRAAFADPTGVAEPESPGPVAGVSIAPNPFVRAVSVRPGPGTWQAEVFSADGRQVFERAFDGADGLVWTGIDRTGTDLPAGVYLLRLRSDGQTRSTRLVLQR